LETEDRRLEEEKERVRILGDRRLEEEKSGTVLSVFLITNNR
jgi:hypothetical protein